MKLKNKLGYPIRKLQKNILWRKNNSLRVLASHSSENAHIWKQYSDFIHKYKEARYTVKVLPISSSEGTFKWVGAQLLNTTIVGIPNDATEIIEIDSKGVSWLGKLEASSFKWTGGCKKGNKILAFPRSSNAVLIYDVGTKTCTERNLGTSYKGEHHYGGVAIGSIVIQPPRNTDHFLLWHMEDFNVSKIQISPQSWRMGFRYSASLMYPNGFVYFIPENEGKVIKLNPVSMEWCFIGNPVYSTVFDVKVDSNGIIYGFASTEKGMIKIDVRRDSVQMIHRDIFFGAYGTKVGINGCLYSIPGNGEYVWEFNPKTEEVRKIGSKLDNMNGKFAGGATCIDGTIIGVPSQANGILYMEPDCKDVIIPGELYSLIYEDTY